MPKLLPWGEHAIERLDALLPLLAPSDQRRVLSVIGIVAKPCWQYVSMAKARSCALCIELADPLTTDDRDQWVESDHFAIIARNGRVVTVMLTRKGQLHPAHLRTDIVRTV